LHIDLERGWRGGQQQVSYLIGYLEECGVPARLACAAEQPLHEHARGCGWETWRVPRLWPWALPALARRVNDEGIQMIHAHSSRSQDLGLALRLCCPGTRLVVSRRVDFHRGRGWYNRWKYRTALVARWIAISRRVAEVLAEDGVPPGRVAVIHSGIDPARIEAAALSAERREALRASWGLTPGTLLFGAVGALSPHKDHETLLRALARTGNEAPNLRVLIAGEGELRPRLEALIRELGLADRARLPGWIEDVPSFLHALDAFVMPSQEEGLGTSVLDAMAAGLAVVATDAGGIPEMIRDGRNGYLVPRRNPEALAAALVSLARDEGFRLACGRRNRQDVLEFTARRTAERTLELYRSILSEA
jgi:glycosyltransferase involved in cell wall biosynthesis